MKLNLTGWRSIGKNAEKYDAAIFGGGFNGLTAAFVLSKMSKRVLLVSDIPSLGFEATWGCLQELKQGDSKSADAILAMVKGLGGCRDGIIDPAIMEICLNRMAANLKINLLYYCRPLSVHIVDNRVNAVVVAGKSGIFAIHAGAFIDATENAFLLKQVGVESFGPVSRKGMYGIYVNGDKLSDKIAASDKGVAKENFIIRDTVWKNQILLEYEVESTKLSEAYVKSVEILKSFRNLFPQASTAKATHMAHTLLPIEGIKIQQANPYGCAGLENLFAAGPWTAAENNIFDRQSALTTRIATGEAAADYIGGRLSGLAFHRPVPCERISVDEMRTDPCDVLVCGGGTAGSVAAISAAREGARTTLIEDSTSLGGSGTAGAIHVYCWGINGGLQDEIDHRINELTPLFVPDGQIHGYHPGIKKVVLQQMADEAKVEVLYNHCAVHVYVDPMMRKVRNVCALNTEGMKIFEPDVTIDSTGDADVCALAGAKFVFGRDIDRMPDPFSQSAGGFKNGDLSHFNFDVGECDGTDAWDLTRARCLGVDQYWQKEAFDEETSLLYIAPLLGVRSSRFIIGDYQITLSDEIEWREFKDAIAFSHCALDKHGYDLQNESDEVLLWVWLFGQRGRGIAAQVPYRALLPKGLNGLLVACRAISMTYDAHYQLRMQHDIQMVAEAAGIAAAQSALNSILPRDIDVESVQRKLRKSGAFNEGMWKSKRDFKGELTEDDKMWRNKIGKLDPVDEENIEELEKMLQGEDSAEAALRLIRAGKIGTRVFLGNMDSDVKKLRFWSAVGLCILGYDGGEQELISSIRERYDELPNGRRSVPVWISSIALAGMIGLHDAVLAIEEVLLDGAVDIDALMTAIRALGRIGKQSSAQKIRKLLASSHLPSIRSMQQQKVHRSMLKSMSVEKNALWEIEMACAQSLKNLDAPYMDIVEKYLDDKNACIRKYALKIK